jgi:hypothetical protein
MGMTVSRGVGGVGGGGVAGAPSRIGWRVTAEGSRLVSGKRQKERGDDTENGSAIGERNLVSQAAS